MTGAAGAQGPAGAVGKDGAAGPAAPTGSSGLSGPQGATGSAGVTGAQGSTGVAGAVGATGSQGVGGPTGAAGATGSQGVAGPTGTAGATGSAGASWKNRAPCPFTAIDAWGTAWPSTVTLLNTCPPKVGGSLTLCGSAPAGTVAENASCPVPAVHTMLVIAV